MNGSPHLQNNVSIRRILAFWAVAIIILLIYIFRLLSLQVLNGDTWIAARRG